MRNEHADFPASPVLPVVKIALLASDKTREPLYRLLDCHLRLLRRATLVAPQATAILCEARFGLSISWINRGPSGGISHVAELVAEKNLDAVIFLRDAAASVFNGADGDRLLKICDARQVPVATNIATAHALLSHLERSECAQAMPLFNEHCEISGAFPDRELAREEPLLSLDGWSPMIASPEAKAVARTRKRPARTNIPPKEPLLLGEVGND